MAQKKKHEEGDGQDGEHSEGIGAYRGRHCGVEVDMRRYTSRFMS